MNTPPIVEGAKRNKIACDGEQEIERKKLRRTGRAKRRENASRVIVVFLTAIKSILPCLNFHDLNFRDFLNKRKCPK